MKNIVVIGQSPAAYAAVKNILDRDPSIGVTLVSCDGNLPYDQMLIPGLIDRSVKENDVFCASEDFYKSTQVQVILDKEISRVNLDRKKVFLADKVQIGFEGLVITDAPLVKLPPLKGIRRQGVFHLARLGTVKELVRYLTFTETALVEPRGFAGIKAALALKSVGKDVIVLARQASLLPDILTPQRSQALATALQKRGIRVFLEGGVEDIIGETEVKAARLKSGKVVACDMVVLEDVVPDMSFMSETAPAGTEAPLVTGVVQALAAVAGLFGEQKVLSEDDLHVHDMLETFFHPQELIQEIPEVTV